jgi:hypothetical protein
MTAPEPTPTAEHTDAVARALLVQWAATSEKRTAQSPLDHCRDFSRAILTQRVLRPTSPTGPRVDAPGAGGASLVDRG